MDTGSYYNVESLLRCSLWKVVESHAMLIDSISSLPPNLKARILYLMQKRGLVTDENISKVVSRQLTKLDLTECEVSDIALSVIATCCPSLRAIDLNAAKTNRTDITSQGVVSLAEGCRHLQVVYLRRCINVGDDGVIALARGCRQLRDLNIGGCVQVTDRSLQALAEHASVLSSIDFSRSSVTDHGVVSLAQGSCANSLREVHMDRCLHVTDDSIEALVYFCPQMRILIFHGCPNITDQSRVALESIHGTNSSLRQLTWTVY